MRPDSFRQELLEQVQDRVGAEHYGEERQETAKAKAERMVVRELKRRGWEEAELGRRPKDVMNRGDRRQPIFADDEDRPRSLVACYGFFASVLSA